MNVAISGRGLAEPLRLLADEGRLRTLRLLVRERLNVSELVRALGMAQSGVSRNVGLLREAGLVVEERRSGWTYLAVAEQAPDGLADLWPALRARIETEPDAHGDDARLADVLRERDERGEVAKDAPPAEPGRSWSAWARALGHLLPAMDVVDLGCGEGALALEIARWARRVDAIDPNPTAVTHAKAAAKRAGRRNVHVRRAPLERTPLGDGCADVVLVSQVLHRVGEPQAVLREAARLLRPGGRLLVMDLLPHREEWVRERLGHVRLGIEADDLCSWIVAAGLFGVRTEEAARRRGNPFTVLVVSALKPAKKRRKT